MSASDAELVQRGLAGNREAFGRVVERYQSLICALAYSATGSLSQSEDLAQETFLIAWKQLPRLREPAKLRSWLCSIARSVIHSTSRREDRQPANDAEQLETIPELPSPEPLPTEHVISREEAAILWRSLERIPELYREPLVLFYREGQSVAGVAKALDLSEDVVKQRLVRGRKLLAEQVAAFVQGALKHSAPGKAFTLGVLAALPVLGVTATATAAGAAAAKGTGTAKTATWVGALAAVVTAGIFYILSLFASVGFLGVCVGYLMSGALRQSARQRDYVIRFWRTLALGFPIFVIPTLLVDYLAPVDALRRGFCLGMTWWLILAYPLVLAALLVWGWQCWRGLPPLETDTVESDGASQKLPLRWLGLGLIVPVCVLAVFVVDICSQPTFEHNWLSGAEAQKIIAERKEATYSVEQYERGLRQLRIMLPEHRSLFGLYTAASESTLALLAEKGITYPTHIHGRHFLGLPTPQQYLGLLSLFLVSAGAVLLVRRPWSGRSATSAVTNAPIREPRKSRFHEMLVALRTEPALRKTFRRVFITVFLLVFGFSVLRAFVALGYYAGTARMKVVAADPTSLVDEYTVLLSERVLGAVVEKMDLNHLWRDGYGYGADLKSSESLLILRMRTDLRPDFDSNLIEILVYDADAKVAAALANAIAETALDYRNRDGVRVQLVDRALPALKPVWPNKPKHFLYGTLAGALLGAIAGVGAAGLRRWLTPRNSKGAIWTAGANCRNHQA